VIGGGPAGTFFSYFLLDMADRMGMDVSLDLYEPRDFSRTGPAGCNMCGGIISESLVQALAAEGIILPPNVVQRGIDSYALHTDVGSVRIDTPLQEKRIGAVHRGSGPRGAQDMAWESFDRHLQDLALGKGAQLIQKRVSAIEWIDGRPEVHTRGDAPVIYDLLAVCIGVNTAARKLFENKVPAYRPPQTTKTFIREYHLGHEAIEQYLGSSMHVFLLDLPRLEFAAFVPKGDYVSLCMLGDDVDQSLISEFLDTEAVRQCFPPEFSLDKGACQCAPRLTVQGSAQSFDDRIVFIGDCGVTRLYKDGIGAAYRTAKAAASTAIFQGVSADDFREHFWPACQNIRTDNLLGRRVFLVTGIIQKKRFSRRALLRMIASEQSKPGELRRMSTVLWDTFTGSAPYREILIRTLHPAFLIRFAWDNLISIVKR
jgi:flavin-dependent dehydrogenase